MRTPVELSAASLLTATTIACAPNRSCGFRSSAWTRLADNAHVTRRLPEQAGGDEYTCVELRDQVDAPNCVAL